MRENPRRDALFAFISWLIVFGLFFAAVQVVMTAGSGVGPVGQALGATGVKVFYGTIYTVQGILLGYAKVFKKNNLRKIVLMSVYLFMGFTTILTVGLSGWTIKFLDNAIISVAAAACWLNWKFRTEYFDPALLDLEFIELSDTEEK